MAHSIRPEQRGVAGGPRQGERPVGGFSAVDASESPGVFVSYLDGVRSNQLWQEWKAETVELMGLPAAGAGLDLGCGTGEEVLAMAGLVGSSGLAVGLDVSTTMVSEATVRHGRGRCRFLVGDAVRLPFADGSFDAARTERTLQHVADPAAAVAELARVLRPGGWLVALEPDWGSLVYSAPDEATSRAIYSYREDLKVSRTVGRHLSRLMAAVGLRPQRSAGRAVTIRSYDAAQRAFNFEGAAEAAVRDGAVARDRADAWLVSLREIDANGGFLAAVMNILVASDKPHHP